ncbi:hypothetical protein GH741_15575 [Aquibacillus halophilus]|uniref:Spore coat protein n=1 Tax=Aquibacillus halophilus TaxID=930132 RepID=A0A6A8DEJ3_9BACI|nr:spore coat protein [Aquibacillus halophilus]MRH44063.1 hypothetical protein [Aquibacillus halophilus]
MIKTVDVGLMANHLSAHKAVISRLELYVNNVQSTQISTILQKQIAIMKNHVQVMNQLLDPKQVTVTLPPIPNGGGQMQKALANTTIEMSDKDIAVDAHFTASSMAKENFNSSENMKNPQVKKMHSGMALQQSTIAEMYEQLMSQMGWMNQPNASIQDQTATITPLNMIPNQAMQNGNQTINQQNPMN